MPAPHPSMPNCDYCRQPIADNVHPYTMRLDLFPAVEPTLEIGEMDLAIDFKAEMERLVAMMEEMDEHEIERQEKLMFVRYRFTLCPACRDKIAAQLERLAPPPAE